MIGGQLKWPRDELRFEFENVTSGPLALFDHPNISGVQVRDKVRFLVVIHDEQQEPLPALLGPGDVADVLDDRSPRYVDPGLPVHDRLGCVAEEFGQSSRGEFGHSAERFEFGSDEPLREP